MIQINELRTGNFIKEGKIEQIDNSIDEVYYSGDGYYQSNYCCNINPIILTEEWLLKFGFKKHKSDIRYYQKESLKIKNHENGYQFRWYESLTYIKHVHQLQNLYFTLVNSELQLLEAGI